MALPNPTKSNYGNADDITPTQMNNIGKNLDVLGQNIQKVGDDTWVITNASHDGTNWNRIDIAKAATAIKLGLDGSVTHYNVAEGINPMTWVKRFEVDAAGEVVTGAVPLARIGVLKTVMSTIPLGLNDWEDITVATGLSTDSIQFIVVGKGASVPARWGAVIRRPDGSMVSFQGNDTGVETGTPPLPTSGNITVRLTNSRHSIVETLVTVHIFILRES